jgi:hypothetical protein
LHEIDAKVAEDVSNGNKILKNPTSDEKYHSFIEKIYKEAGNRGCFLGNSIASDHCFFKSRLEYNVQRRGVLWRLDAGSGTIFIRGCLQAAFISVFIVCPDIPGGM